LESVLQEGGIVVGAFLGVERGIAGECGG
jgi:hypothetical protein